MKVEYLILTALLSSSTCASDFNVEICALQTMTSSNTGLLQVCDSWQSQNQCGGDDWITWDMSENQGQMMYSTALAAFSMDKKVKVRLDGSSCIGSYDVTSMIRIMK